MKHRTCTVCGGKHMARGLCSTHYSQLRRGFGLGKSSYARGSAAERIRCLTVRNPDSGCLEWTGNLNRSGYGRISIGNKSFLAHRLSYETFIGPIEVGALVCHACDNPRCVEPSHLFLGSDADNSADKVAKGRQRLGDNSPAATLLSWQVLAIRADERPQAEIAKEYGVTQGQISFIKRYEEWRHLPLSADDEAKLAERQKREARGQRYPHCKLTPDDVRAIRAADGTHKAIAAVYGVDPSLIGLIKKLKIWRHVV